MGGEYRGARANDPRGPVRWGAVDLTLFTLALFAGSVAAGMLGALTGLGGGVVIIPLLVLVMGVDLRYAIGASLVAVIATSAGAAATFRREGLTNLRIGILLEVATTVGAIAGAVVAAYVSRSVISTVFGLVLLWTAWTSFRPVKPGAIAETPDPLATRLRLDGVVATPDGPRPYRVRRVPAGFLVMFGAGVLSALVGIGSGIVKVLAMDRLMRVPFKVSTATSNFMIGVTAAASVGVYLHRGQIEPALAAPVALGALGGAFMGGRLLPRVNVAVLRRVFAVVVLLAAVQMIYRGAAGRV